MGKPHVTVLPPFDVLRLHSAVSPTEDNLRCRVSSAVELLRRGILAVPGSMHNSRPWRSSSKKSHPGSDRCGSRQASALILVRLAESNFPLVINRYFCPSTPAKHGDRPARTVFPIATGLMCHTAVCDRETEQRRCACASKPLYSHLPMCS